MLGRDRRLVGDITAVELMVIQGRRDGGYNVGLFRETFRLHGGQQTRWECCNKDISEKGPALRAISRHFVAVNGRCRRAVLEIGAETGTEVGVEVVRSAAAAG